jgi:hypothetical protein
MACAIRLFMVVIRSLKKYAKVFVTESLPFCLIFAGKAGALPEWRLLGDSTITVGS